MSIIFSKYQGTGNDFILIDGFTNAVDLADYDVQRVRAMCDRRFGIGADGLMILTKCADADFEMLYFNSDGSESTMCGNGGRCIVAFAKRLGVIGNATRFRAIDGLHDATINADGIVNLSMIDVSTIEMRGNEVYILNTGSPHYVQMTSGLNAMDLVSEAQAIRYGDEFKAEGINVNYLELLDNQWHIRTYERGVEAETYSCGTGVTAAALAIAEHAGAGRHCSLITKGGLLTVNYQKTDKGYSKITLNGPATHVFDGEYLD